MIYVFIFLLGTIIGSFLNVCIYRMPIKQSIVLPHSYCPRCNIRLKALDLVPVLSFLFLGRKCRYCEDKISYRYPLIEFFNGLIYLFLYLKFGFSLVFVEYSILCSILIVVAIIDYNHKIIPDNINIFGILCAIAFHIINFSNFFNLFQYFFGFIIGGGFLLSIAIISKGGMGGGDIKLMAMLGLWLGWKFTLLTLFLSFFLGGLISIVLVLFEIKGRKDMIPFGPFIVLATMVTVFYGNNIINYYIMTFMIC